MPNLRKETLGSDLSEPQKLCVIYRCKAGCGHVTVLVDDFMRAPFTQGWATIEGKCPGCGADQFPEEAESAGGQFRPE